MKLRCLTANKSGQKSLVSLKKEPKFPVTICNAKICPGDTGIQKTSIEHQRKSFESHRTLISMKKINADRAAGLDFEVEVCGDSPATFCVLYRSLSCEAQAEIEGGFNDQGKHDWLIYAETLTYKRTAGGFKQTQEQSGEILDRMKNGMMCLGMDCRIV